MRDFIGVFLYPIKNNCNNISILSVYTLILQSQTN